MRTKKTVKPKQFNLEVIRKIGKTKIKQTHLFGVEFPTPVQECRTASNQVIVMSIKNYR